MPCMSNQHQFASSLPNTGPRLPRIILQSMSVYGVPRFLSRRYFIGANTNLAIQFPSVPNSTLQFSYNLQVPHRLGTILPSLIHNTRHLILNKHLYTVVWQTCHTLSSNRLNPTSSHLLKTLILFVISLPNLHVIRIHHLHLCVALIPKMMMKTTSPSYY